MTFHIAVGTLSEPCSVAADPIASWQPAWAAAWLQPGLPVEVFLLLLEGGSLGAKRRSCAAARELETYKGSTTYHPGPATASVQPLSHLQYSRSYQRQPVAEEFQGRGSRAHNQLGGPEKFALNCSSLLTLLRLFEFGPGTLSTCRS